MGTRPQCPAVEDLLRGVRSLTRRTEGTFQISWDDSFPTAYHCREQGGFIYIDFPIPPKVTRAYVTRAPPGESMNQRQDGPPASIDLNRPGTQERNVILVANFHTHPLSEKVHGNPEPSGADIRNAYHRGVPGIVISRKGIYAYGPERRTDLDNPRGYASPQPLPGQLVFTLVLPASNSSPPWVVPGRQWPEGVQLRSITGSSEGARAFADEDRFAEGPVGGVEGSEATAGADSDDGQRDDVIYVEWSDEGIAYGEDLPESEDLLAEPVGGTSE